MSSPYGQLLSAKNKTKKTRYWQGGDKYFRAAEQPSSNICCAVSCSPVVLSLRGLKKKKTFNGAARAEWQFEFDN